MKNKIEDLRNHLFATLEGLRDEDKPMELERAREIANVAKVIVDTARAENDFLRATGVTRGTGFIELGAEVAPAPPRLAAGPSDTPLRSCECGRKTRLDPCEHCNAPWKRVA